MERYAPNNKFCQTAGLLPLIEVLPPGRDKDELNATVVRISKTYERLSSKYHGEKSSNKNNTLTFD